MKRISILAAMALVAGCATTTETADVNTVDPIAKTDAPAPGSQAELDATAGNRVYFGYDQYSLRGDAQATLRRQAEWMNAHPDIRVRVAGNADERGTREYNLALGARRAEAARAYLISLGVAADRIETVSFGKERPAAQGHNEQAWSENRNSTTQVLGASS